MTRHAHVDLPNFNEVGQNRRLFPVREMKPEAGSKRKRMLDGSLD